jgi:hypothetical protein
MTKRMLVRSPRAGHLSVQQHVPGEELHGRAEARELG